MTTIRSEKDIQMKSGLLTVSTQRENVAIPLDTINHIVYKKAFSKNDINKSDVIHLYTDKHVEVYVLKFDDGKLANSVYHSLLEVINENCGEFSTNNKGKRN